MKGDVVSDVALYEEAEVAEEEEEEEEDSFIRMYSMIL